MTDTLDKLNSTYDRHKDQCSGSFHNALWQLMINESCKGAFHYLESDAQVVVALPDGGYVPALFDIQSEAVRDEIISDLNINVFGLDDKQARQVIAASFHGHT
jgi:hypothetical protein